MMKYIDTMTLVLAGDSENSYGAKIKSLIDQFNLQERVLVIGKVTEAQKIWLLKNATLLAMPSSHEGFGLPVIEAHSLETPTIVSRESALPETAGPHSFYFSDLSPKQMSSDLNNSLQSLENDFHLAKNLKLNSSKYSWNKTASDYEDIYKSLIY